MGAVRVYISRTCPSPSPEYRRSSIFQIFFISVMYAECKRMKATDHRLHFAKESGVTLDFSVRFSKIVFKKQPCQLPAFQKFRLREKTMATDVSV